MKNYKIKRFCIRATLICILFAGLPVIAQATDSSCTYYAVGGCGGPSDDENEYIFGITGACTWSDTDTCDYDLDYSICKTENYEGYYGCYTDIRNWEACDVCTGSALFFRDDRSGYTCLDVDLTDVPDQDKAGKCGEYFQCRYGGDECLQCKYDENSDKCTGHLYSEDCTLGGGDALSSSKLTMEPCRNPCYEASGDGSLVCGSGMSQKCGVCMRTSLKEGRICCGQVNDTTGLVRYASIQEGSCNEDYGYEQVDYDKYCYTGICQTNSRPYVDRIEKEGTITERPFEIIGNPEFLKELDTTTSQGWKEGERFPPIYYKNFSDEWTPISGAESEGIKPPYVDGGKLDDDSFEYDHGYPHPEKYCSLSPPEGETNECRVETSSANLDCEMFDLSFETQLHRKQQINAGSCVDGLSFGDDLFTQDDLNAQFSNTKKDIIGCTAWDSSGVCTDGTPAEEDVLPLAYSLNFKVEDDATVEGQCGREADKLNAFKTFYVTMCPGGERDLDALVFKGKNNIMFADRLKLKLEADGIKMKIDPHDDFCGFVNGRISFEVMISGWSWDAKKDEIDLNDFLNKLFEYVRREDIKVDHEVKSGTELDDIGELLKEIQEYHEGGWLTVRGEGDVIKNKLEGTLTMEYRYKKKEWRKAIFKGKALLRKSETQAVFAGISTGVSGMKKQVEDVKEEKGGSIEMDAFDPDWFNKAFPKFSGTSACCPHNAWVDNKATTKTTTGSKAADGTGSMTSMGGSVYCIRNGSGVKSDAYYFGYAGNTGEAVRFESPVTMFLDYDEGQMPNYSYPKFYKLKDDYIQHQGLAYTDSESATCSIGTGGGVCASADGKFRIDIPAGAVTETKSFVISKRVFGDENWLPTYPKCDDLPFTGTFTDSSNLHCSEDQRTIMGGEYKIPYCYNSGTISAYIKDFFIEDYLYEACADDALCVEEEYYPGWNYVYCKGPQCLSDSDGLDFETAGTVTTEDGNFEDTCIDTKVLLEYTCEEGVVVDQGHACPQACREGRCQPYLADKNEDGIVTVEELLQFETRNRLSESDSQYVDDETLNYAIAEWKSQDESW